MTVQELITLTGATDMTPDIPKEKQVTADIHATCSVGSWLTVLPGWHGSPCRHI